MARTSVLSTRVLLVCAAIGVATGAIGAVVGITTPLLLATIPILYGLTLSAHVLPGIMAQEVLRQPWVAVLTHLLAALVASAFTPGWAARYIGTAILFGLIQEGVAALTRYRNWGVWRYFISALIIGVIIAVVVGLAADLGKLAFWAQISYIALAIAGPIMWTAIAVAVGRALRQAGVARR